MDKRPQIIARMFDRIASSYDLLNTVLSFSMDKSWRRAVVDALSLTLHDTVLDIATGTGDMAMLALRGASCTVAGLDVSREMLIRAAVKAGRVDHGSRYALVQGDALRMPFPDAAFTKAMVGFGIRNMPDLETLFREVHRVLKARGRFAVLEFSVPRSLPWRWGYLLYLNHVMPVVGGVLSGDFEAYRYLRDSVLGFPSPPLIERMLEEPGLKVVESRGLFGSIAHLYLAEKTGR